MIFRFHTVWRIADLYIQMRRRFVLIGYLQRLAMVQVISLIRYVGNDDVSALTGDC